MKILIALLALVSVSLYAANRPQQVRYISPSGSDANPGTLASPWLSPNHSLNCGDIIIAAAGAYAYSNFASGKWGTVTCASGQSVAYLKCEVFDACTINAGANFGMWVDKSYWGVFGWEATTSASGWTCFAASPPAGAVANIHHVIFANDIANGCGGGGLGSFSQGNFGVDYIAIVGSIAYNAAQNGLNCYSGISIFQPVATDSVSGTHIYMAGNFAWANQSPAGCPFGAAASGLFFDTFDWQGASGSIIYNKQAMMENNIAIGNGGSGIQIQNYVTNPSSAAIIIRKQNTLWGNEASTVSGSTSLCAELITNVFYNVTDTGNLAQAIYTTKCPSGNIMHGSSYWDTSTTSGSSSSGNLFFAAAGAGSGCSAFNGDGNTFSCGINVTSTDPAFTSPATPGAPLCGAFASVSACMAAVVAMFTPTAGGTTGYGYQTPSPVNGSDQVHYPQWLCKTGLPYGLATPHC